MKHKIYYTTIRNIIITLYLKNYYLFSKNNCNKNLSFEKEAFSQSSSFRAEHRSEIFKKEEKYSLTKKKRRNAIATTATFEIIATKSL